MDLDMDNRFLKIEYMTVQTTDFYAYIRRIFRITLRSPDSYILYTIVDNTHDR
jgi:hypothetical protein